MSGIVYDARKVLAYEGMLELEKFAGKSEEFLARLWEEMVLDEALVFHTFRTMLDMKKEPDTLKTANVNFA